MVDRPNRPSHISPIERAPQPIVSISEDNWLVSARLPTGESLEVHLCGATVTSWKNVDGSENLWLSDKAVLDGSKAIRGGIPVVFPVSTLAAKPAPFIFSLIGLTWANQVFGPPPKSGHPTSSLPQHGFARSVRWEYLGKTTSESSASKGAGDSSVKLDFGLYSSALPEKIRSAWPYDFGLVYSVTLAPDSLITMVTVRNEGKESFEFKVLLHSYFRIKDVSKTKVTGLLGVAYSDKVLDGSTSVQSSNEVSFSGEVDRIYANIPQNTTSIVEAGKPRFDIIRDKLADTVVWNPWKEKSAAMGDFYPKDGFMQMVCVEVGAVDSWTKLEGGEEWEGGQVIKSHL
jgi:glucose-6-phosphate 1-epimerase